MLAPDVTALSHREVNAILERHRRYRASAGAEGELADLSGSGIEDFAFDGMDLSEIHAHDAVFARCSFVGANLYFSSWTGSHAAGCDFREAQLAKCEMQAMNLQDARFDAASAIRADLSGSDLRGASFLHAKLDSANLDDCDARGARFTGASLIHTSFEKARLDGAELDGVAPPPRGHP